MTTPGGADSSSGTPRVRNFLSISAPITRRYRAAERLNLYEDGIALAAAGADRGAAEAAAAALELADEGSDHPGTGSSDRVTEGDCAAVHVDLVLVDVEHLHGVQRDRSEGLVDLPDVDVGRGLADLLEGSLGSEG